MESHIERAHKIEPSLEDQIGNKHSAEVREHQDTIIPTQDIVNQEQTFACDICDKNYYNSEDFKHHVKHFHQTEEQFIEENVKATDTSKSKTRMIPLKINLKKKISDSRVNFKCNICGKLFNTILNLDTHMDDCHFTKREFASFCQCCKTEYVVKNDHDDHILYCTKLKTLPIIITHSK